MKKFKVIVLIFMIFVMFVCLLWQFNGGTLKVNGYSLAVVLSGSMEPELAVNDLVLVKEKDEYHASDIVVFRGQNEFIVHRIIEIDGDVVITKGDANNKVDDSILVSDIEGAVIGYVPFIGLIIRIFKSPIVLLILALILVLLEISFRIKEKRCESFTYEE